MRRDSFRVLRRSKGLRKGADQVFDETKIKTASAAEMVAVRMFGDKFTATKDGLEVTGYRYKGRIFVDGVERTGPRLVEKPNAKE